MAIIKTRYRDVEFEELCRCKDIPASATYSGIPPKIQWANFKGMPIEITTPPLPPARVDDVALNLCEGPFYHVVGTINRCVCPHIAEIGD